MLDSIINDLKKHTTDFNNGKISLNIKDSKVKDGDIIFNETDFSKKKYHKEKWGFWEISEVIHNGRTSHLKIKRHIKPDKEK